MTNLYHVRPLSSASLELCFAALPFLEILSFLYQFLSLNICQSPLVETIAFINQRSSPKVKKAIYLIVVDHCYVDTVFVSKPPRGVRL